MEIVLHLYFKVATATLPSRRLSQQHMPLGDEAPNVGRQADGGSKGSLGHTFMVLIRTGSQNKTSFYPSVPHEISILLELILGHLRYLLTDVQPRPNSSPDNVIQPDRPAERAWVQKEGQCPASDSRNNRIPLVRTSSELAVQRTGSISSSSPTADGLGTGTPVPSPQSQSFSLSYRSILKTSLIVPLTRGGSP
ncbi:Regulator of rDNA transcription protein 15 [Capsicum baccatum]|uniref:Regulator of rDNA transcription protein 15 n=1 Tax=Capsicum baccatum TaxID=33114 RepID=A0A2G2V871_CAPBA|nr:Regulator of rDNA transcription protein 15 [Capsicum baccatum]